MRGDRWGSWREHGAEVQTCLTDPDREPLLLVSGPKLAVGAPGCRARRVAVLPLGLCPRDCLQVSLDLPGPLPCLRPLLPEVLPPPSGGAAAPAPLQSQGALAGRLRSFSMQDLRTIPDGPAPTYQDPLYLEDQVPRRRPPIGEWAEGPGTVPPRERNGVFPQGRRKAGSAGPQTVSMPSFASRLLLPHIGYRAGGLRDSDTDNECWSDTEVVPQPPARPREKPLGRSQSLRVVKRKPLAREVSSDAGTREGGCPCRRRSPDLSRRACLLSPNRAPRAP